MILALHLLVRQVPTSVPVPSAIPPCFLLVTMIEVTLSKRLFSLTWSGRWRVHLMRRGRIYPEPVLHRTPTWVPFYSHLLQGASWRRPSSRRCSSPWSPRVPRTGSSSAIPLYTSAFPHSSSAHTLLGTGPGAPMERGSDRKLPGPTNTICVNYNICGRLCVQYKYNINLYNLIIRKWRWFVVCVYIVIML